MGDGEFMNSIIFVLIILGGLWLQMKLSKSTAKLPGLILPGLSFLSSLSALFGLAMFQKGFWAAIGTVLPVFLMMNVPTLILYGIYHYYQSQNKMMSDIDKMKIQDL